ncbi:MAG: isoleucine--tRNA ligase [Rickettsiaceae bacterium]|nr:MAG: isoleucine--tRNA ligase [Rickettsiaceae bacterium]
MKKNNNIYPEIESAADFPSLEKDILSYWQTHRIFERSIEQHPIANDIEPKAKEAREFVFYDGPPFANGLPHYGHLLTGFIKDVYARYQTMKGKRVERRFGWDCHGLPAEMGAEKELGFSGRVAITKFGIDKFNAHCKSSVMKYTDQWEEYVNRQARWVDFNNSYKTMDTNFMESVIWAFKELYKKGLVYESMRVMPYSWACETPLSNFETRLDNSYRERADKAVTCSFLLEQAPSSAPIGFKEYKILAWTTTPWTLPSNLALAVKSDMEYVFVPLDDCCYVLAKWSLSKYAKELQIAENVQYNSCQGSELEGIKYQPLFDYFAANANSFKILLGDFVTEGDGTGVVHLAPGFGEDDQILCAKSGISLVCPVDNAGKFTDQVTDFVGQNVFDANDNIIIKLKENKAWLKTEQYLHNYPHCWRTDTPLIYKAVPSWYIKVTEFKDRMVELNQQINWIPGNVKDGLFGKWIENARDWSISRNRFWGTPIPIWRSNNPKYPRIDVYGSLEELRQDFGVDITDLHRPYIDQLTRPNPDDETGKSMMVRVEDVFDCWFESGSMPYGQAHYPFENKDWFEQHFPADFIVEYSAQTRGWFYTLMVLSTALFDKPPFQNCICHGVILDADGQKLSKRLNNYADPIEIFDAYGSDALRVTMLSSSVVKGQELLIDKEGKMIHEHLRLFIKPIWSAYHFFTLYANADQITASLITDNSERLGALDRYILAKLNYAINMIDRALASFDTQAAYQNVASFFEVLNNWYIRRSRTRFWSTKIDDSKLDAYNTLYTCLATISRAMSPLLPLLSEVIYLGITRNKDKGDSVHLTSFPTTNIQVDDNLTQTMDLVLDICSCALFVRNNQNIRTRQPLNKIIIVTKKVKDLEIFTDIIKDEINIKSVIYKEDLENYADVKLNINFPVLGKRLPNKIKEIIASVKAGDWQQNNDQIIIANEMINAKEYSLVLQPKSTKGARSLSNNEGLVILDLEISQELYEEGIARDLIRFIQQARKNSNLKVSDKIALKISGHQEIIQISNAYKQMINEQTLSVFDEQVEVIDNWFKEEVEVAEKKIIIAIERISQKSNQTAI